MRRERPLVSETSHRDGSARLDRTLTLLVPLALFAFYVVIQRGEYVSWDGRSIASVARNIWEFGSFKTLGYNFPDTHALPHDSIYSAGLPMLLVPFWVLQAHHDLHGAQWMTIANPLLLAACGAVLYRVGIALRMSRSTAVGMAFVFGALTMAPMYSTDLFAEPGVTFGATLALLGCIQWRHGKASGPWCIGVGTAVAMMFRADSTLLVGVTVIAIPFFVPVAELLRTWRRWLPALAIPIGAAVLWAGYYNNLRYGSPFEDSYPGVTFSNPLLDGLQRQLLSPGKGFFWYDPILLAALPGLVWLVRRDRGLGGLIIGLSVLRVLVFAKWPFPDGSIAWGPRFLLPWCALLTIPLAETWEHIKGWAKPAHWAGVVVIGFLAALSAVVVVASVWVPYAQYWDAIGDFDGVPTGRVATVRDERIDASFNTISASPLVFNLRHLDDAKPFGLRWFRDGPTPLGIVAGVVAGTAGAIAIAAATAADRRVERSHVPRTGLVPAFD